MALVQVSSSRACPVPAPLVYDVLADSREAESERGLVASFTVEPKGSGGCRVSIVTTWKANGFNGLIEQWLVPSLRRPSCPVGAGYRFWRANLPSAHERLLSAG